MRRSRSRHSPFFRLLTALFGVWFTFTLLQPNGMSGMTMSSMPMTGMSMNDMPMSDMSMSGEHEHIAVSADVESAANHSEFSAAESAPAETKTAPECDQHDCCCSALSPISLMPNAALAWLPDHIIDQHPPQSGECVVHAEAQLKLPFANGPPRTVIV